MDISFHSEGTVFMCSDEKNIAQWLANTIVEESKEVGEISIIFTSDEYLLTVNKEHLNHDYFTDIITFDYCIDTLVSGDLFISIDRVTENAGSFNVSFNKELKRVLVHGVLHLCGYKDKSSLEQREMRTKEDFYLSKY